MQKTIIKKDFKNITSNKRMLSALLIVPLVMTVVLPLIFILTIIFIPESSKDLQSLIDLLPDAIKNESLEYSIMSLIINNVMPVFFLIIPIMASSVMAAGSFVGEKEKRTLETLLYSPLSIEEIFKSKIVASFLLGMLVSLVSFAVMTIVVNIVLFFVLGYMILPNISWLVIMLLVAPALSLISITMIVRGSAKAQTFEESQQHSVFLIIPIILLIVGQFTGVLLISPWVIFVIGIIFAIIAIVALRGAFTKFNYEMLLQ